MRHVQGRIQDWFITEQKHPDLASNIFKDRYFSCFAPGSLSLSAIEELFWNLPPFPYPLLQAI